MKAAAPRANDERIAKVFRETKSGAAVARRIGLTKQGANAAIRRLKLRRS